jgi:hypothetical protein
MLSTKQKCSEIKIPYFFNAIPGYFFVKRAELKCDIDVRLAAGSLYS